jgi:hypothetical protein
VIMMTLPSRGLMSFTGSKLLPNMSGGDRLNLSRLKDLRKHDS